jgi:3-hydroxyisobutyrate dehydrogenase-like beta-hydroxyacid dehydrogenase
MVEDKLAFIGFGEVGYTFSKELNKVGANVMVYDILLENPEKCEEMKRRILDSGCRPGSLEEVLDECRYILSAVVTQEAINAARECVPFLNKNHIYLDLNSTSPSIKVELKDIIEETGAHFVEGAILGAIGATGFRTRIFTGGSKGKDVADYLNRFGMNVYYYSPEIGKASMFKMLRSIFSKGIEVLLLEMLVAGKRAGIDEDLWSDISEFMSSKSFDKIAANWIESHAVAHNRRYHEMLQVIETMEEIGIEPVLTKKTASYFKRSIDMKMKDSFSSRPSHYNEVIEFIESKLSS